MWPFFMENRHFLSIFAHQYDYECMNSKYTNHYFVVWNLGMQEARRLHHKIIYPEHFVLGMLKDGTGKAIDALRLLHIDLDEFRRKIEEFAQKKVQGATQQESDTVVEEEEAKSDMVTSDEFKRLIIRSQLEGRMLKQPNIDTEHVMLALLKDENSSVFEIFCHEFLTYDVFCRALRKVNGEEVPEETQDGAQEEEDIDEEEAESNASPFSDFVLYDGKKQKNESAPTRDASESQTPFLDNFGYDITQAAKEGKLDPVVGRAAEIERLCQILSRRKKNNPILLGEPGVGKTAIVEGLAQRIISKQVSFLLIHKRIVSLDLAALVAGTKYRGQFEERLKGVMREVCNNPDIILYIDEIHTMIGAGNAEGSMDAANMLKPALSRGELQCIGSTTLEEYRKTVEKDGALERRFQKVLVEPTNADDTLAILHNIRERYEEHHHVRYTDDALQACVALSERYISDRNLPDKAIDVMDEAGSRMHLNTARVPESVETLNQQIEEVRLKKDEAILSQQYEMAATYRDQERHLEEQLRAAQLEQEKAERESAPSIDNQTIADVVAQMTGIPVQKVASSESQRLLHLRDILRKNVIGQDNAIDKVVRAIQRNRVGLKDPKRPIGTFLFLGPTGVGKTYLAKKIAEELFATPDSLIRIDMSEFMEKYSTSRLIGAAPGYVGYDEGGQLTEKVRRRPYSVILFDEIEKADHEVFNLLLQLFDEGHLTDASGRKVDFKNCIIILTSNVGSRQLGDFGTGIGFQDYDDKQRQAANESVIRKELKRTFSPEFLNRIDDIITFRQLSHDDIRQIVDVELQPVLARIKKQGYDVEITEAMKAFLSNRGYDPKYGARPLRRAIQEHIEDALCERILQDEANASNVVEQQDAAPTEHHIVVDAPAN